MGEFFGCIGILLAIIFGTVVLRLVVSALGAGASAAVKSATGKGSFESNFNSAMMGMSVIQYRLIDIRLGEGGTGPLLKEIQVKGLFPLKKAVRLGAVTHVYDVETGLPLICALEQFQEEHTVVFKFQVELGRVEPNQGLTDWVRLGAVLPEIMTPPVGGLRKLIALIRFIDLDSPPYISRGEVNGFLGNPAGILWTSTPLLLEYTFDGKGFQAASQERDMALDAAVCVAVFMAMADGQLHDKELVAIRNWIKRSAQTQAESRRNSVEDRLLKELRDCVEKARSRELTMVDALTRLNEVEETALKYEVLQLAFDVLTADGVPDSAELAVIDRIASALELDRAEVERIRDKELMQWSGASLSAISIEDLLGIKRNWERPAIQQHLRKEFTKWNGRLVELAVGPERENAQRMLDLIADARRKYG